MRCDHRKKGVGSPARPRRTPRYGRGGAGVLLEAHLLVHGVEALEEARGVREVARVVHRRGVIPGAPEHAPRGSRWRARAAETARRCPTPPSTRSAPRRCSRTSAASAARRSRRVVKRAPLGRSGRCWAWWGGGSRRRPCGRGASRRWRGTRSSRARSPKPAGSGDEVAVALLHLDARVAARAVLVNPVAREVVARGLMPGSRSLQSPPLNTRRSRRGRRRGPPAASARRAA
jgi:hypothetical protein